MNGTDMPLLEFSERGMYCQKAGVFIDPWNSVPRALVTHAHSDHARPGSGQYLCTPVTGDLIRARLGSQHRVSVVNYGETTTINGVQFSFHPAGHIPGSAQIRIESGGEVWVVSGDYKTQEDNVSEPFELVRCHTFVTESTFGLPVYQWPDPAVVFADINAWWKTQSEQGITSVLSAYSLGKAQRVLNNLDFSIGPVYCHGAVQHMNTVLFGAGVRISPAQLLDDSVGRESLETALVITPGNALNTPWMRRFRAYSTAAVSGWMILRGRKRWQNVDRGFILSDHADWNGLNTTIRATGCERVVVTHGYSTVFARWLRECGYQASAEKTTYEGENE